MAFYSTIGRLVQLNTSLERALLDFGANFRAYISSHIVNPWANGVIRERNLVDFFSHPIRLLFQPFFCAWLHKFLSDSMRILTLRNSIYYLVAALKNRIFLNRKSQMR